MPSCAAIHSGVHPMVVALSTSVCTARIVETEARRSTRCIIVREVDVGGVETCAQLRVLYPQEAAPATLE